MELNDPFVRNDGGRISDISEWDARRKEIYDLIISVEYGDLPPKPDMVRIERLHTHQPKAFGKAEFTQYRLVVSEQPLFHFRLDVLKPQSDHPVPCILTGDGCWKYATSDAVQHEVLSRDYALAIFSRVELAPDIYTNDRTTALYTVFPEETFGALAAWAWGYHRCIDAIESIEGIDETKIAVVGHSRGGKAALLAGATDERIAVTAPNNSGCGGAGCYKWQGPESETIADTHRMISYWFGPELWQYIDDVEAMPFDQHYLKALVAPRALISTEGLGDLWSNPEGTYQSYLAAREVYRFLGVEERIGIWYREGGHNHGIEDWRAFLDFVDLQFSGGDAKRDFSPKPFPGMPPAFRWASPK